MKKFGTPRGAGPGNENENVGFADVGTPPAPVFLGLLPLPELALEEVELLELLCLGFLPCAFGFSVTGFAWWFTDGRCVVPDPGLFGVDVVDGVVAGGLDVVVPDVVVVGVESDVQLSVTAATGAETGSGIDEIGVPAGTFTVKASFWPPTNVTLRTHGSADAAGSQASVAAARTPAVTTLSKSFRVLNTLSYLLPRAGYDTSNCRRATAA